jgi:hypothetical protein
MNITYRSLSYSPTRLPEPRSRERPYLGIPSVGAGGFRTTQDQAITTGLGTVLRWFDGCVSANVDWAAVAEPQRRWRPHLSTPLRIRRAEPRHRTSANRRLTEPRERRTRHDRTRIRDDKSEKEVDTGGRFIESAYSKRRAARGGRMGAARGRRNITPVISRSRHLPPPWSTPCPVQTASRPVGLLAARPTRPRNPAGGGSTTRSPAVGMCEHPRPATSQRP